MALQWYADSKHQHDATDFFVIAPNSNRLDKFIENVTTTAAPEVPTVAPGPGDDLSPPNSVEAARMNAIVFVALASAGWSSSPQRDVMHPSKVAFDVLIADSLSPVLDVKVTLEYTNPFPDQSMCVHAEVAKTLASSNNPLVLVSSSFQDEVDGNWVDITPDIAYTQTADAVVAAVMADPKSGQTAGRVRSKADTVDAKLGPIGSRGRVLLRYRSGPMYEYSAMGTNIDGSDLGTHRLAPLAFFTPWAILESEAGMTSISISLSTPPGTGILSPHLATDAYKHLYNQDIMKRTTMVVVPSLDNTNEWPSFEQSWTSLPPSPTSVILWLAMPVATVSTGDEFVDVAAELTGENGAGSAVLFVPTNEDTESLTAPLPGFGAPAHLYRLALRTPLKFKRQTANERRIVAHLTISDGSGSTGCRTCLDGATIRERFNELAVLRYKKRLASIPALLEAEILRPDDIWVDAFFAFDGNICDKFWLVFRVGDHAHNVPGVLPSHPRGGGSGFGVHTYNNMCTNVNASDFVNRVQAIGPSGLTSFEAAAEGVLASYEEIMNVVNGLLATSTCLGIDGQVRFVGGPTSPTRLSTFVNFDTDGGDNGTVYVDALKSVVERFNVVSGVVTGFGSWLNQHAATTVASVLDKSIPPLLALTIPELGTEGSNRIFRRSFVAWLDAVRMVPMTLAVSAGAVMCRHPRRGEQFLNAVDVLALEATSGYSVSKLQFGPPDISDVAFTGTTITGGSGGHTLILYIASRLSHDTLASTLRISVNGEALNVTREAEQLSGEILGHTWLQLVSGFGRAVKNRAVAVPNIMSRIEDELSFRFQLAAPSGSTSYLGRAKTQAGRPAIDAAHTPTPPGLKSRLAKLRPVHGSSDGFGSCGGFGQSQSAWGSPSFFGGAPPPAQKFSVSDKSCTFGASPASLGDLVGAPSPPSTEGLFGASSPSSTAGLFGATPPPAAGGLFGTLAFAQQPAAAAVFGGLSASQGGRGLFRQSQMPVPLRQADEGEQSGVMSWNEMLTKSQYVLCGNVVELPDITTELTNLHVKASLLRGNISYTCDVCRNAIQMGTSYMHCMDCDDYDECIGSCEGLHKKRFPSHTLVHRVIGASSAASVTQTSTNDPFANMLLGTTHLAASTTSDNFRQSDRAPVVAREKLRRFLSAMLEWWPLIRSKFVLAPNPLPEILDEHIVTEMTRVLHVDKSDEALAQVATVVVETLARTLQTPATSNAVSTPPVAAST